MYWRYSITAGVPFLSVPMVIPFKCNLGCLILLLPQIYWFYMIVRGIFKFLFTKNNNEKPVANGGSLVNHALHGSKCNGFSEMAREKEL